MRKWIVGLAVLLVVLGVSIWLLMRGDDGAAAKYQYAAVTRADVSEVVTGSGSVRPTSTLVQRAYRPGTVTHVGVDEGDAVKAGTELFRVDDQPVYALIGTTPFYRLLTSDADEGKDVRALQNMLKARGYYDGDVNGTYTTATQTATRDFLDDRGQPATSVVGPETFQTVSRKAEVLSRAIAVGDRVRPGQPATLTLTHNRYEAVVDVNEIDIAAVVVGQKATLTLSALPGQTFKGTVTEVSPGLAPGASAAGAASGGGAGGASSVVDFPVIIVFDSVSGAVKSGMSVDATIVTRTVRGVLTVPVAAVQLDGATSYVQIVPEGGDGEPVRVDVEVGLRSDTLVEIKNGLSEGQSIVEGLDVDSLVLPGGGLLSRPDQLRGKQGAGQ